MIRAMGAAESAQKTYTHGYHVLNVHAGSPGATAGLQSFFDVIVSAGGTALVRALPLLL